MSHEESDSSALEELEALPLESRAARVVDERHPGTPMAAARAWVASRGIRPGARLSPPTAVLREAYRAHAREAGWDWVDVDTRVLMRAVYEVGVKRYTVTGGFHGFWVARPAGAYLWAFAPPGTPTRPPRPKHTLTGLKWLPPPPELFWERLMARRMDGERPAKPLVDARGRVWPNARTAARGVPRGDYRSIHRAAAKGDDAHGLLWRFLAREELALVPKDALVGGVVPALAWDRPLCTCSARLRR